MAADQRHYTTVTDDLGQAWHLHGERISRPGWAGLCPLCLLPTGDVGVAAEEEETTEFLNPLR